MTHQNNGQMPHQRGPLEAAVLAEDRLVEQLNAMSERLDRLATSELELAKERLARSAALLADRIQHAREFAQATVSRVAYLMAGAADLFSDDVTRFDEVVPAPQSRPLTEGEQQAIAEAPWEPPIEDVRAELKEMGIDTSRAAKRVLDAVHQRANAGPPDDEAVDHAAAIVERGDNAWKAAEEIIASAGPPDDEDDPEDDVPTDDDEECPRAANVERALTSAEVKAMFEATDRAREANKATDSFDADNYVPPIADDKQFIDRIMASVPPPTKPLTKTRRRRVKGGSS